MPRMKVQCSGSGRQIPTGLNTKRGACPRCHRQQNVTPAGRIRRHDRILPKRKVRKLA